MSYFAFDLKWCNACYQPLDNLFSGNFCHLLSTGSYLQTGPKSGPTFCRSWSGSKLFDHLIVFLKEFFEKVNFEKSQQRQQKHEKLPSIQRVTFLFSNFLYFIPMHTKNLWATGVFVQNAIDHFWNWAHLRLLLYFAVRMYENVRSVGPDLAPNCLTTW